jgi:hypothetical protein
MSPLLSTEMKQEDFLYFLSGICHGMTERLPALCRQATALDRIALVLVDKYRHLAGTELIRLIYPHDFSLLYILN